MVYHGREYNSFTTYNASACGDIRPAYEPLAKYAPSARIGFHPAQFHFTYMCLSIGDKLRVLEGKAVVFWAGQDIANRINLGRIVGRLIFATTSTLRKPQAVRKSVVHARFHCNTHAYIL
jgi:hypothetical protein